MSEHTLILLRHAKSDWSGDESDIDRPLNKRGRRQAADAGRWLADAIRTIDLVVLSPAKRARGTWDLASRELESAPPTKVDDSAYAASATRLLSIVRALPDDVVTVILVAHNPGIEELASALSGESVPMPTSALAVIGLAGSWSTAGESAGRLLASGRPPA